MLPSLFTLGRLIILPVAFLREEHRELLRRVGAGPLALRDRALPTRFIFASVTAAANALVSSGSQRPTAAAAWY